MNCEHIKELLSAYLDDVLAPEESRAVTDHLQDCQDCNLVLADFRRFDALLSFMPRISPRSDVRKHIFSSPEYLFLETFAHNEGIEPEHLVYPKERYDLPNRPRLVALPGGRYSLPNAVPTVKVPSIKRRRRSFHWGLLIMQTAIAVMLLLTLCLSTSIGWNLWHRQQITSNGAITPPAGLPAQSPLATGMRFVFLRNGVLWSASSEGNENNSQNGQPVPLTSSTVTVATTWAVSQPLPGRSAGNLLAYIDLRQARLHLIRSDGQRDIIVSPPLLPANISPSSIWQTETGTAILHGLAWSNDGRMLAFIAQSPEGLLNLYILSTDTDRVQLVPLPVRGNVFHPIWSPDSIRLAFEVAHNNVLSILDYNTQNHGMLTILQDEPANETIQTLDWSPYTDTPALTWSLGTAKQVDSIWLRRVGLGEMATPTALIRGNFTQASYSRNGDNGVGSWLLLSSTGSQTILSYLDAVVGAFPISLTTGNNISTFQWSPNGKWISYLDTLTAATGSLHILNKASGIDRLITLDALRNPAPAWSVDGKALVYSTGIKICILTLSTTSSLLSTASLPLYGLSSTFIWANSPSYQLLVDLNDGKPGIYVVDTRTNTFSRVDGHSLHSTIQWTQIP